ncbi:class I SAM-dependent methyltransferase [Leptolyngbya ohadii]|uniref:class I SAM-dependent methyltransferase n=1 Tax=Leptolyngbya ohadii TaxID=1962290 RepID=UPI000B59F2A7|nr:class I SAM-dependent methyltransferase [Leptolyngbya ohadii]
MNSTPNTDRSAQPPSIDRPPHSWDTYYKAVEGRPPRETLLKALEKFDAEVTEPLDRPRFAVDLGCGDGRDTIELLHHGWHVLAIDGEPKAFDRLLSRPDLLADRLQTRQMRFEALTLPDAVDLINASFCLPFCPPDRFQHLWRTIVSSLRTGGRFCGHLFGDRDSWVKYPGRSHHTREQVEALLQSFEVEWLEEEEHPGVTAIGEEKDWHIFHIVARRRI